MNHEVFAALGEALSRGEEAALVTIVSSNGSTPQRVGAKMLVFGDGRIVGTVGGGCYEHDAIGKARQVLTTRKPTTVKYDLNDDFAEETGLVCGGQMEVFIEPIEASPAVYIFGAGHVGYYLAKMAYDAGFGVHVIDDRAAFANTERFPFAASVVVDDRVRGNPDAPVTMVEYSDFTCGFCLKFFKETWPRLQARYVDTGKVRFLYKDYPRADQGPGVTAAVAARCAGDQGAYWPMHDRLFAERAKLGEDVFFQHAKSLGLDHASFS